MKTDRQADQAWADDLRQRNLVLASHPKPATGAPCPNCDDLRVVPHPTVSVWLPCPRCGQGAKL